ncbi:MULTISPECIES: DUF2510 domain-containing protein [unclassified Streptomyces]|uniref:DUF2510 domain-containing protein n=1 Tax=Streptomyces sp. NBC_00183 TaxID=2903633 RepID=UPI00225A6038|nr:MULTISPECIES: DUF2510 domain-containing protein [unclassified Streptomyces]MCX5287093.1 DUF2510 domain-containing protein [Streptomyces sp. NBC_00183]
MGVPRGVDALVARVAPATAEQSKSAVPAGWYANPSHQPGSPRLRYWDGAVWTDRFDG